MRSVHPTFLSNTYEGVVRGISRKNEEILIYPWNCFKDYQLKTNRRRLGGTDEDVQEKVYYGWKGTGEYETCFPKCGKWRYEQLSPSRYSRTPTHFLFSQRDYGMRFDG